MRMMEEEWERQQHVLIGILLSTYKSTLDGRQIVVLAFFFHFARRGSFLTYFLSVEMLLRTKAKTKK
jgi:hypothetical protein